MSLIGPPGWPIVHRLMFGALLLLDCADYARERIADGRRRRMEVKGSDSRSVGVSHLD